MQMYRFFKEEMKKETLLSDEEILSEYLDTLLFHFEEKIEELEKKIEELQKSNI